MLRILNICVLFSWSHLGLWLCIRYETLAFQEYSWWMDESWSKGKRRELIGWYRENPSFGNKRQEALSKYLKMLFLPTWFRKMGNRNSFLPFWIETLKWPRGCIGNMSAFRHRIGWPIVGTFPAWYATTTEGVEFVCHSFCLVASWIWVN